MKCCLPCVMTKCASCFCLVAISWFLMSKQNKLMELKSKVKLNEKRDLLNVWKHDYSELNYWLEEKIFLGKKTVKDIWGSTAVLNESVRYCQIIINNLSRKIICGTTDGGISSTWKEKFQVIINIRYSLPVRTEGTVQCNTKCALKRCMRRTPDCTKSQQNVNK